jgi:hypothetical protein
MISQGSRFQAHFSGNRVNRDLGKNWFRLSRNGIIRSLGVENESLRAPSEQASQENPEATAEEAPHRTATTAATPQQAAQS